MGFPADVVKLLGPAIEAGRKALREMDAKEVPAALRKVRSSSGGNLPPPFANGLLVALDADPDLRDKAVEASPAVTEPGDGAGPAARASAAFLSRGEGWWEVVAAARAEVATAAVAADVEAARKEATQAREKATEAKRRERDARSELKRVAAEARTKTDQLKERLRGAAGPMERALAAAEDARSRAEADLEQVRSEREALRNEVAELTARWRRARKELAEAERAVRSGSSGSLPQDPVARAKRLDEIASQAKVPVGETTAVRRAPGTTADFAIPAGISPDRADAVEWLITAPERFTLVVDGYNVTFLLSDDFSSGAARDRLNRALGRLQRAMRAGKVIVVYDSKLAGQRRALSGPEGIEVRFSPEGTSGDDTVVALAGDLDGPVVVVSSDREVRERSAVHRAVTLWSEALVDWIGG